MLAPSNLQPLRKLRVEGMGPFWRETRHLPTMALFRHLLLALLLLNALKRSLSFTQRVLQWNRYTFPECLTLFEAKSDSDANPLQGDNDDSLSLQQWGRRTVVGTLGISAISLSTITLSTASHASTATESQLYNVDCLLDLPPVQEGCVRIYLCRHGETENNRLGKVQGARVDPSINYNGIQQALRLGTALAQLEEACPTQMFHSHLLRSRETAEYASRKIFDLTDKQVTLNELDLLNEVDFGSVAEGKPLTEARGGMIRTAGAWAAGYVDARGEGGGESGREVSDCERRKYILL